MCSKYTLGVPVYHTEKKYPVCKTGLHGIHGHHAVSYHSHGDGKARRGTVRGGAVPACFAANLALVVEKRPVIPNKISLLEDSYASFLKGSFSCRGCFSLPKQIVNDNFDYRYLRNSKLFFYKGPENLEEIEVN